MPLTSVTEEQNLTILIYSPYALTHTYACNSLPSQRNTASCSSLTLPMLTPICMPLTSVTEEQNVTILIYSPYALTHTYACHSLPSQRNTASCSSLTLPMLTPIHMPLTSVTEEQNL